MEFLNTCTFASEKQEDGYLLSVTNEKMWSAAYTDNVYPFRIFPKKDLGTLSFAPITILYGGNGSGKSTVLNLIAEALHIRRLAPFNHTPFYEDYLRFCKWSLHTGKRVPDNSLILTSDAVFDFLLDVRARNDGIDNRREEIFAEYDAIHDPNVHMQLTSLDDYEEFRKFREAKRKSRSQYTHKRLADNSFMKSNGESAYLYFCQQITENALFLLDEPENSLSASLQKQLAQFLEESVRFYNCQLVISTHSPFLLALKGAKIYDLDALPVRERPWTELEAVRIYYDFFKEHEGSFS